MLGPRMTAPSLRKNVAWSFAGSAVLSFSQLAIVIALAKLGGGGEAGAERNGTWTWALAVTGPIFVFGLLKLRALETTDARGEHAFAAYAQLRAVAMVAALAVTSVIVLIAYRNHVGLTILGVALAKAFEGGSDIVYGRLQHGDRLRQMALSQIGRAASALGVTAVVVVVSGSMVAVAFGVAAVYLAWMLVDVAGVDVPLGPFDRGAMVAVFWQALPLGAVSAIGSLQIYVPRYYLEHYVSRGEQGVFANMAQLLAIGALVVAAMANAAAARMARAAATRDWRTFNRVLRTLVTGGAILGALAVIVSAVAGRWIMTQVFSRELTPPREVLVWMSLTSALVWTYVFLGTALDALRSYKVQPWIHGASTAVIALAAALLVPSRGRLGAAWAMLIGFSVECGLYLFAVLPLLRRMREAPR